MPVKSNGMLLVCKFETNKKWNCGDNRVIHTVTVSEESEAPKFVAVVKNKGGHCTVFLTTYLAGTEDKKVLRAAAVPGKTGSGGPFSLKYVKPTVTQGEGIEELEPDPDLQLGAEYKFFLQCGYKSKDEEKSTKEKCRATVVIYQLL